MTSVQIENTVKFLWKEHGFTAVQHAVNSNGKTKVCVNVGKEEVKLFSSSIAYLKNTGWWGKPEPVGTCI